MDAEALELATDAGVFDTRTCKLCDDGVVVMGEYGLSSAIMKAGYNIATLMSMCAHNPALTPLCMQQAIISNWGLQASLLISLGLLVYRADKHACDLHSEQLFELSFE